MASVAQTGVEIIILYILISEIRLHVRAIENLKNEEVNRFQERSERNNLKRQTTP